MTIDDLREALVGLVHGQRASVTYDVYTEIFPPGEPDVLARKMCYEFARSLGCRIENHISEKEIWFIKE